MAKIVWENRDNLPYAWRILRKGVCDGCALGVAGFHDWTISGVHLCMTRLNLLRAEHDGRARPRARSPTSTPLRTLVGRGAARRSAGSPYPMVRRAGERGFRRVTLGRGARPRSPTASARRRRPERVRALPDRARHHQRDVLRRAEGRAVPRHQQRRQRGARLPRAVDRRAEATRSASPRPRAPTPT